jgi:hypothetical protein
MAQDFSRSNVFDPLLAMLATQHGYDSLQLVMQLEGSYDFVNRPHAFTTELWDMRAPLRSSASIETKPLDFIRNLRGGDGLPCRDSPCWLGCRNSPLTWQACVESNKHGRGAVQHNTGYFNYCLKRRGYRFKACNLTAAQPPAKTSAL